MNKEYDWIVVDAPPMNPVADPAVLLSHVHHALFVVRAFKTTRKGAKRAAETLATTPSQVLGVIMNNVDVPPSRDESHEGYPYYYYYGYGYGNYGDYRYGRRYGSKRYGKSGYGRRKYGRGSYRQKEPMEASPTQIEAGPDSGESNA
jgi:Mrp family chromosome partitioning ATPase